MFVGVAIRLLATFVHLTPGFGSEENRKKEKKKKEKDNRAKVERGWVVKMGSGK